MYCLRTDWLSACVLFASSVAVVLNPLPYVSHCYTVSYFVNVTLVTHMQLVALRHLEAVQLPVSSGHCFNYFNVFTVIDDNRCS
jgi:hypothetical protein